MLICRFARKRPLIFFVILNYAISWTFLYPCYQLILNAEEEQFPLLALIGIPGGFGPSIAAIITVWITEGKPAVIQLLKKFKTFRVNIKWYVFVLALPIVIYMFSFLAIRMFGFGLGEIEFLEGLKMIFPYILLALPFGPLMEELGWRGYMLPKLLKKYNLVRSSLVLGVVWTFWHIASFTFPGAAIPSIFEVSALTIFLYLLNITTQTFIFSYVYVKTNGSLILAILLHAAFNASENIVLTIFPGAAVNVEQLMWVYVGHIVLVFLVAIILFYELSRCRKGV